MAKSGQEGEGETAGGVGGTAEEDFDHNSNILGFSLRTNLVGRL